MRKLINVSISLVFMFVLLMSMACIHVNAVETKTNTVDPHVAVWDESAYACYHFKGETTANTGWFRFDTSVSMNSNGAMTPKTESFTTKSNIKATGVSRVDANKCYYFTVTNWIGSAGMSGSSGEVIGTCYGTSCNCVSYAKFNSNNIKKFNCSCRNNSHPKGQCI